MPLNKQRWTTRKGNKMTPKSILRLPDVKQRTGLSRSSIYNAINAGVFPRHVSLGARAVGWLSNDIDEWIASRNPAPAKQEELKLKRRITRTRSS